MNENLVINLYYQPTKQKKEEKKQKQSCLFYWIWKISLSKKAYIFVNGAIMVPFAKYI